MRVVLASLAAVALSLVAYPVLACGGEASFPVEDPVVVRPQPTISNVSASDLLVEARRLEVRAASLDSLATQRDQRADQLTVDARALRIEAASTEGNDRAELVSAAESLAIQAAQNRAQAQTFRSEAASLRTQARVDRSRAVQLVNLRNGNGGGGWRNRVPRPATASSTVDL